MKIRKAVLLLACAVSWGIAVWFAGRLWAAYPLVSVRSDVPVTGRQLEALRSALRQEDGASALVPAFWSQAEGSAESRWETCGITAILYCGEYDAVYPAVLLEGRFPAAQENGKCAVSTAAAWQLWGSGGRAGAGIGDRRRHLPRVRALSQQRQPGPVRGKP